MKLKTITKTYKNLNIMKTHLKELVDFTIDRVKNFEGTEASELHYNIFNTDHYIVGYYQAEEWLKENSGIFKAIGEIKEYEDFNFGEAQTDLSNAENVVNMYVYIKGEEILQESETISNNHDKELTPELIALIVKDLEELI